MLFWNERKFFNKCRFRIFRFDGLNGRKYSYGIEKIALGLNIKSITMLNMMFCTDKEGKITTTYPVGNFRTISAAIERAILKVLTWIQLLKASEMLVNQGGSCSNKQDFTVIIDYAHNRFLY